MESYTALNRLRELHGSGFEIVDGQPNIIGWTIKDSFDNRIGVVDDLLFDPDQQKVRYIIANLKDNAFDLDKRKVIIPIGTAELHETNDDVIVPSITRWQLRALPTYSQQMTDYDERDIDTIFSTGAGTTTTSQDREWQKPSDFYNRSSYNHDNLFKKRRKPGQLDTPIERTFRTRGTSNLKGEENYQQREATTGRNTSDRSVYEPDEMLVHNDPRRNSGMETSKYDSNAENESVLNRIRRMQQELNEIERDLRSNRDTRQF